MTLANLIKDNPDLVALVVGSIVGVFWKRGKNAKADDLWETLLKVGKQAFPMLLRSSKLYDDAYVSMTIHDTITKGLKRLGVPVNPLVLKLVDEAVEHVKGELAEMVFKYHVGQLEKPLAATLDLIKAAPADKPIGLEAPSQP